MAVMGPTEPVALPILDTVPTSSAYRSPSLHGSPPPPPPSAAYSSPTSPLANSLPRPTIASPQKKRLKVGEDTSGETVESPLTSTLLGETPEGQATVNAEVAPAAESVEHGKGFGSAGWHHEVAWAVAAEKGYRNKFINSYAGPAAQIPIHPDLEDVYWPGEGETPTVVVKSQEGGGEAQGSVTAENQTRQSNRFVLPSGMHVFILADGHGGVEAPRFFVKRISSEIRTILESRDWDFSDSQQQSDFRAAIHTIFRILDAAYASRKVEEYRKWMDSGSDAADRPDDDGCTLLVNVLCDGWLCNINVGDSRTIVGTPRRNALYGNSGNSPQQNWSCSDSSNSSASSFLDFTLPQDPRGSWQTIFASSDHNMTHPAKIHHINATGGQFVYPFGSLKTVTIYPSETPPDKPYTELAGMRIYRPPTPQIKAVGVSHRRTLNLSATMGDLLFKVEPAVLNCLPDVEFVPLDPHVDHILVAATDGVWDHMREQNPERQSELVLCCVAAWVEGMWDWTVSDPAIPPLNAGGPSDHQVMPSNASSTSSSSITSDARGLRSTDVSFDSAMMSGVGTAVETGLESSSRHSSLTTMDSSTSLPPPHPQTQTQSLTLAQRLSHATRMLIEREGQHRAREQEQTRQGQLGYSPVTPDLSLRSPPELYYGGQFRYDDATAFVLYLKASKA
ncbi:phosphatase 2C-like domain-containing protein [Phlyctochytrium arcticum]|nr:phosphatase 2C-like domain-containing protein [Phlyctochytrium arcticum]